MNNKNNYNYIAHNTVHDYFFLIEVKKLYAVEFTKRQDSFNKVARKTK